MSQHIKRPRSKEHQDNWITVIVALLRRLPTRLLEYVIVVLLTNHTAFQDLINLIRAIRGS